MFDIQVRVELGFDRVVETEGTEWCFDLFP